MKHGICNQLMSLASPQDWNLSRFGCRICANDKARITQPKTHRLAAQFVSTLISLEGVFLHPTGFTYPTLAQTQSVALPSEPRCSRPKPHHCYSTVSMAPAVKTTTTTLTLLPLLRRPEQQSSSSNATWP